MWVAFQIHRYDRYTGPRQRRKEEEHSHLSLQFYLVYFPLYRVAPANVSLEIIYIYGCGCFIFRIEMDPAAYFWFDSFRLCRRGLPGSAGVSLWYLELGGVWGLIKLRLSEQKWPRQQRYMWVPRFDTDTHTHTHSQSRPMTRPKPFLNPTANTFSIQIYICCTCYECFSNYLSCTQQINSEIV